MAAGSYSFIDIAVLEPVRARFAAGDALAILSIDLDEVFWANGAGAALLGFADIEAVMGASPGFGLATRRQISAAPGFPRAVTDRPVAVRLAGGVSGTLVPFLVSGITMPDGEPAILLAVPAATIASRSAKDVSARIIEGVGEAGYFAALLDGDAAITASSPGFDALGLSVATRKTLVGEVFAEPDRLVKRLVPAAHGLIPAGLARLTDEPAVMLLIAVNEAEEVADTPVPATEEPVADVRVRAERAGERRADEDELGPVAESGLGAAPIDASGLDDEFPAPSDADMAERIDEDAALAAPETTEQNEASAPPADGSASAPAPEQASASTEAPTGAATDPAGNEALPLQDNASARSAEEAEQLAVAGETVASAGRGGDSDDWYFSQPNDERPESRRQEDRTAAAPSRTAPAQTVTDPRLERPDRASGPVRFVWRTDADGAFSAISDEFARAVGGLAADVIGKSFRDVAARFGIDPDGDIAGLLDRRDTWSGRSVLWPVTGTDLLAPVDLAALPVYNRERIFEGFRGFGVVRMSDVIVDANALGLRLATLDGPGTEARADDAAEIDDVGPAIEGGPAELPSSHLEMDAPAALGEAGVTSVPQSDERGDVPDADVAGETPQPPRDPFHGEVPVISIAERRERRSSDKIIRLAERRHPQAPGGQLSAGERSAFDEIRERLRRDYEVNVQPSTTSDSAPEAPTSQNAATDGDDMDVTSTDEASVSEVALPEAPQDEHTLFEEGHDDEPMLRKLDGVDEPGSSETWEEPIVETEDIAEEVAEAEIFDVEAELAGNPPVLDAEEIRRDDAEADDGNERHTERDERPAEDGEAASADLPDDRDVADERLDAVEEGMQPADSQVELTDVEPASEAAERQDPFSSDDSDDLADEEDGRPLSESEDDGGASAALEDFEDLASTDESVSEPAVTAMGSAAQASVAPVIAPPIAASGFVPSAFSGDVARVSVDADLIDGLPLAMLVHAGDDLYFANREFLALTGYASLDQIRREGGLDRLFADRQSEAPEGRHGRKPRLRTLGGDEFPVDAHLQSIRWRGGSALLLAVRRIEPGVAAPAKQTAADMPASDQAESRVAEMRTIIDTATDGVVLIDNDGTIRNISRPAEALFGFDSADAEGKPFTSLFAIESQRAARDYLNGLAENGVASVLNDGREVIGREAHGRFIPLFMTIGRLPGGSGFCAVVRDITQWKRAEEELTQARSQAERASAQKTEFLARVSHEIRTPLNAIIGFSELMMDEKFGPIGSDRYRDYLRDINRSGNHVLDLVNDLLDISKIEAGEQEMNYEAVSLNDTLAESVAMMQPQANRDRVIIRSSLASRLPEVVADLRSVRQIALNLLSNAIRYTQAGGQVIVSTSYEPTGDVIMRVRDTGIGMTLSEIDQALKPFKQINALKRGRHDGTGLGLPLTKAMVEANRARFAISSTPGEGTMVEITFPSTRVLAD